jgi:hypothetical protein
MKHSSLSVVPYGEAKKERVKWNKNQFPVVYRVKGSTSF